MIIDAVIVTYRPDVDMLERVIESIIGQVRHVHLVDNSDTSAVVPLGGESVFVDAVGRNVGIGAAQNRGMTRARQQRADFVLLADQDTVFPSGFVKRMLPVFSHEAIAAVAPLYKDAHHGRLNEGFIAHGSLGFRRIFPSGGTHPLLHAIASGLIIRVSALAPIGMMDESLFIDWVDLEWCWRANARGFVVLGNADVCVSHVLGDGSANIGFRRVNTRSPTRHYYITRNAFHLALRSPALSRVRRVTLFFKSFRYVIGFPVLCTPRSQHLRFVLRGLVDGIRGRVGPMSAAA